MARCDVEYPRPLISVTLPQNFLSSRVKMPTSKPKPSRKTVSRPSESWWTALKLVALKTLAKGDVPFVTLCLTILGALLIYRVDSKDFTRLAELLFSSSMFALSGWGLAAVALVVVKYQALMYKQEIRRVTEERNFFQAKLIPGMKSSNHKLTLIDRESSNESR